LNYLTNRRKFITTFHPRTQHSSQYYYATISALLEGVTADKTDRELAQLLTDKDLLSPTGVAWTPTVISKTLWKLRNYRTIGSTLHNQLLQLCFDGVLTREAVLPLYQSRTSPRMTM
jgi:hypothetical protein